MNRAEIVNPLEDASYDGAVAVHPEAGIFHSSSWARVVSETYGWQPLYVVIRRTGELRSVLPLMEGKSFLKGRRAVSVPFADSCPALIENADDAQELWSRILSLGQERGWKYVELRGSPRLGPGAAPSVSFWGHVLDLGIGEKELLNGLHSTARRSLRKARDFGVEVKRAETLEAMRTFYGLHCKTRKKHGLPPQPWSFFVGIHKHILSKGQGLLLVASYQAKPIASAMFLHSGKQAVFKFGASDPASQHLRGNNLVMWEAIIFYAKNGAQQLHFGRTSRNNVGLRRFKVGWGAREHEIDYQKFDFACGRFVADRDRAEGWHNQVFKRLPTPLLRAAGTVLYRHME